MRTWSGKEFQALDYFITQLDYFITQLDYFITQLDYFITQLDYFITQLDYFITQADIPLPSPSAYAMKSLSSRKRLDGDRDENE